jgi:asparagine synthase (glutamine-hydrolysing)
MSGIFGILNFDGQPVAREHLEAMRASMAYWGPDGSSIWQAENIGLGHLLLHNTPEACYESLPRQDPASSLVLTAHVRIDNREELISDQRLGIGGSTSDQAQIPDSQLILRAYLHWGEECVHHLIGDWAFAVWDPRQRRLFLARDHHGISSIYTYRRGHFFAFASCIKALLALPDVPQRPNLLRVAQVLTSWSGDGVQTAYEDIFRLPPAHMLAVTADKMAVRRYWDLGNTPPVRFNSDEKYVEAFLEIYAEAVRCRLRSPLAGEKSRVGATLSSGLDSSSVCALAARELGARGQRLPVFTSVPIYPTEGLTPPHRYGDESPLVEINRQFIGNLDVQHIHAEDISPLAGIERDLELHDSPTHAAGNMFWIYALWQSAQWHKLSVLLTGAMGNGTISWSGDVENFWPLLLTGQWRTLWSKSRRSELSLWKVVRRHLLRPVILPIRNQVTRVRSLGHEPWAEYSAINLHFARSLDLTRHMKADGHDPLFIPLPSHQAQLRILQPGASILGALRAETGPAYGLEVRDPTMDKRLMEFCLAIPEEQYSLHGQDRALIRRAMVGLLPDQVRLNTRRGLQAADLGHRLLAELPRLQAILAQLERSALACEVLDLPKMNRVLQALQKEVNAMTTTQCLTILTRGMMAGMFLLRF